LDLDLASGGVCSLEQVEGLDVRGGSDMEVCHAQREPDGSLAGSNRCDRDGHDDTL